MRNRISVFITLFITTFFFVEEAVAVTFSNETLKYVVSYKWGLVHKDAGDATLSLHSSGGKYVATLTARTRPWADKVFQVRDTLRATMSAYPFRPIRYEKQSHEGDKYSRDVISYTFQRGQTKATVHRTKVRNGKVKQSHKTFSTQYEAYDMLSIFYFLRTVDYAKIPKGRSLRKVIFSGSSAEFLNIRNMGIQTLKLRSGKRVTAYHLKFNFTDNGGKQSSADMDTWISTKAPYIPYQLEGELPVGKVKCYLVSQ